jgi:hypothetical protein
MLTWIIQFSIISIIFIFMVHHILLFFKSTLTIPKIKDLVNSPNQKYQNIYDTILHTPNDYSNSYNNSYTNIDLLPLNDIPEQNNMKDELKSFLKKQLNTKESNDVIGLDTMTNGFSNFN